MANTLSPNAGWQEQAGWASQGLAGASQGKAPTYDAPTLSPYTPTGGVSVGYGGDITSSGVMGNHAAYLNPYLSNVVDTSLANYDLNGGKTLAQLSAQGAANNAFGGSRWGIAQANTLGNLALGRGQLESGLRSDAWNNALTTAMQQAKANQDARTQQAQAQAQASTQINVNNANNANQMAIAQANLEAQAAKDNAAAKAAQQDRQLTALSLLANNANLYAGNDRADLALIAQIGAQQQALQQAQASAPATQLGVIGSAIGAIPGSAYIGQDINTTSNGTETQSGGSILGSILGGIASGVGGALGISDRSAKTDIRRVGVTDGGAPIYAFRYKWGGPMQMGVMADDIAQIQPHALGPVINGYQSVNYAEVR